MLVGGGRVGGGRIGGGRVSGGRVGCGLGEGADDAHGGDLAVLEA